MLSKGVDNIFAIGQSRRHSAERYIKHLKPRNAEALYDASHLPVFRLTKIGGNFLGLEFTGFSSEKALLIEPKESPVWPLIEQIKQMHDEKMPIRAIADKLGISKTATHRYLQMWHPQAESVEIAKPTPEAFPGASEYNDALDELSERLEAEDDGTSWDPVFWEREYEIVDSALDNAKAEFERTGIAPKLEENAEYVAFTEAVRAFNISDGRIVQDAIRNIVFENEERDSEQEPVPRGDPLPIPQAKTVVRGEWEGPKPAPFMYDKSPNAKAWLKHLEKLHPDRDRAEINNAYRLGEPWCRPPGSVPPIDPEDPFAGMRIELDGRGNAIYIEDDFSDGKPRVWYKYEHDTLYRFEHDGIYGVSRSRANPNLFGKFVKRE